MAAVNIINAHHGRQRRNFRERLNPMNTMNDREIVARYRLTRTAIEGLVELIENDVEPKTNRSHPMNAMTKTLVTLRYLAKGSFYSEAGDIHGVSRSSVSRCVTEVVTAINKRLDNISYPTDETVLTAFKKAFYNVARIPNALGAVDGTLLAIIAPSKEEEVYVCRKGYHAINVQAVVGPDMRFTDVVAKWPGSQHDSSIFDSSAIKTHLERYGNGWLLGDSGYAQRPYLLTPKANPTTAAEAAYNEAHSRTRMVVERAFGVLKSRFRCLHKSAGCLPFAPPKCCQIATACMRLHNLCLTQGVPLPPDDGAEQDNDNAIFIGPENRQGNEIRQRIINNFV